MKRSLFVGCLLLMLTAVFFWTGCEQATDEVIEGSGLPKAPDSFEVFAADGEVLLSWNIYQPNNQDIIRFEVEYGEGDTAPFPAVVPVAKEWDYLHSSILIKNLTNNTLYGFRVRAVNNKGNSPWSVVQSATPQRATVAPVTPASVSADESKMSATAEGANLFVQWNPSAGASKYEVRYSTADLDSTNTEFENTAFIFKSADGATTITEQWANIPAPKPHGNAPLALDTKYYFWVRAGNEVGWSSWAKGEATTKAFSGTTAPNIAKTNKHGVQVHNYIYIEVNETDPRVAMGYTLEDGTPFFDDVIIFSANLRDRDCALELDNGETSHDCRKSGIHLHYNGNVAHLFNNLETYIRPMQEKGIKVRMGLLPDWGGYTYGTMGEWPFENSAPVAGPGHIGMSQSSNRAPGAAPPSGDGLIAPNKKVTPWQDAQGNPKYPYDFAARSKLIDEIVDEVVRLGLDGVDFDDEWASGGHAEYLVPYVGGPSFWDGALGTSHASWNYYATTVTKPNGDGTYGPAMWTTAERDAEYLRVRTMAGRQGAEFYVELKDKLNEKAKTTGKKYITTVFEYQYNQFLPETIIYKDNNVKVRDYVDYFAEALYGTWRANPYTPNTPYGQYSPMAVDMGHGGSGARPTFTNALTQATNHLNGDYGVMFFYGLYSRNRYGATGSYTDAGGNTYDTKPTYFGTEGRTPEEYMSQISNAVYGQNVIYGGDDYPQDWTRR